MATDANVGAELRDLTDGVMERPRRGHKCCGGDDALLRCLDNSAVNTSGHAKVVGIDDQSAHNFSVASKKKGLSGPSMLSTLLNYLGAAG